MVQESERHTDMKTTCATCGVTASIAGIQASGVQYQVSASMMLLCPVVADRMEKNGGKTDNTDCDNLLNAVQIRRAELSR